VASPTVVLGSTQSPQVIDAARAVAAGITVVRRRTGGGAVLLRPGDHVWVDVWLPKDDPLWEHDVAAAAGWVGRWWAAVLLARGVRDVTVHTGPIIQNRWSEQVCFAGTGPGEVLAGGRKVVGVAQWRSREGSLFRISAYRHWDPGALVDVLSVPDGEREVMRSELSSVAAGLFDLAPAPLSVDELWRQLPRGRPWSIEGRPTALEA
jgi:lipoate-protein ligase A